MGGGGGPFHGGGGGGKRPGIHCLHMRKIFLKFQETAFFSNCIIKRHLEAELHCIDKLWRLLLKSECFAFSVFSWGKLGMSHISLKNEQRSSILAVYRMGCFCVSPNKGMERVSVYLSWWTTSTTKMGQKQSASYLVPPPSLSPPPPRPHEKGLGKTTMKK